MPTITAEADFGTPFEYAKNHVVTNYLTVTVGRLSIESYADVYADGRREVACNVWWTGNSYADDHFECDTLLQGVIKAKRLYSDYI